MFGTAAERPVISTVENRPTPAMVKTNSDPPNLLFPIAHESVSYQKWVATELVSIITCLL